MSGYRQSSYDPEAYQAMGRPLRPYSKLQWAGVVIGGAGVILSLADLAHKIGWVTQSLDIPRFSALMLLIIGVTLVNSRREGMAEVSAEQRAANRKLLIITILICVAILGAAAVLEFTGAN